MFYLYQLMKLQYFLFISNSHSPKKPEHSFLPFIIMTLTARLPVTSVFNSDKTIVLPEPVSINALTLTPFTQTLKQERLSKTVSGEPLAQFM